MQLEGNVKLIGQTESFGKNNFLKRELVITTQEQYPQTILIEFIQDKTELLDKYSIGDLLKVSINIRGREWVNPQGETKYFNSIQGWRVEKLESSNEPQKDSVNYEPSPEALTEEEEGDLPF